MTLKPCPFCGGAATAFDGMRDIAWVTCAGCEIKAESYINVESAITAWNHRPGEEAVAEECARIAEAAMDGIVGAEIAAKIRSRFGGKS